MNRNFTIVLCASVSFYKQVVEVRDALSRQGYTVLIPDVAQRMHDDGNYSVSAQKTWYQDPTQFVKKKKFMDDHFEKIAKSDAILVVNEVKNDVPGYIGGNVLMEIAIAYYLGKYIFLLHPVVSKLPLYEEIMGINPVVLNGDVSQLAKYS